MGRQPKKRTHELDGGAPIRIMSSMSPMATWATLFCQGTAAGELRPRYLERYPRLRTDDRRVGPTRDDRRRRRDRSHHTRCSGANSSRIDGFDLNSASAAWRLWSI